MANNGEAFTDTERRDFVLNPDELKVTTFLSDTKDSATLMIIGYNIKGTLHISSSVTEDELKILAQSLYSSISDTLITSFETNGEITKC